MPANVYMIVYTLTNDSMWTFYYVTMFVAFFNICANPFIYIAHSNFVKASLVSSFSGVWSKFRGQSPGTTALSTTVITTVAAESTNNKIVHDTSQL